MKIEILEHIMQIPKDYLSQEQRQQAFLQIRDGGLGLTDSSQIAQAAYVASVRSSWEYLISICPRLKDEIDLTWLININNEANPELTTKQVTQDWIQRVERNIESKSTIIQNFLSAVKAIAEMDPKFSIVDLFIKEMSEKEFIRLQNRIQKPIRQYHHNRFLGSLTTVSKIRLDSCIGNREDASAWLETMPQDQSLTMPDQPFINALKLRLGLKFPELIITDNDHLKCLYCNNTFLDEEAHHLVAGCPYNGHRYKTHQAVVYTLIDKILGKATRKAQKGTTIIFNPNANPKATNKEAIRPDIEVYHKGRKDLLDVTICDRTLPFLNINRTTIPTDNATAENREKQKLAKYRDHGLTTNSNGKIIPIAIESFGKMGKLGFNYLTSLAQEFGKGYKATSIKRYWFRLISVALQKQIGEGVNIQIEEIVKGKPKTREEQEEEERIDELISTIGNRIHCVPTQKGLNNLSE